MENAAITVKEEVELMDKETYRKFIVGLGEAIRSSGVKQEDLAVSAETSKTNLSRVLNFKSGCSPRWRRKICGALGVTEDGLILKGERELFPAPAVPAPTVPASEIMDIVSSVAAFAKEASATRDKLRFWKDIFHYLPCSVLLLRDGVLLYQNLASQRICRNAVIGENLCLTCKEKGDNDIGCIGCMVEKTQQTGVEHSFRKEIKGRHYIITTSFITINSMEYQAIVTTEIEGCEKWSQEGADNGQKEKDE